MGTVQVDQFSGLLLLISTTAYNSLGYLGEISMYCAVLARRKAARNSTKR
jgi:hypothetical protein